MMVAVQRGIAHGLTSNCFNPVSGWRPTLNSIPVVNPDKKGIVRAVEALEAGRLLGMPTETVYGLAADAGNAAAVAQIYAVKGRPDFNPLIAHVASIEAAQTEGHLDERALRLAQAFWPGPVTLIVPVQDGGRVCELARAGLNTIGLRIPSHPVAQELLRAFGRPLVAPSANPSGRLSPTAAAHVAQELDDEVALVLDGGLCSAGIESTIIAVLPGEPIRLLRPGAADRAAIETLVGSIVAGQTPGIIAPGQLASHYAPRARLRLDALTAGPDEVLLGFGPNAPQGAPNLSVRGDLEEAAARLYQTLREIDATGVSAIAVMPVPETGLGEAINDRLRRAAAPRD